VGPRNITLQPPSRLGRRFGWNILVPIGQGSVTVSETFLGLKISYLLSFRELFVTVTVMMFLFFVPSVVFNARSTISVTVFVVVGGWAWLFGGNILSSILRFPRFLRIALLSETLVQPPKTPLEQTVEKSSGSAARR
jgi:hypothetical protein